MAKFFTWFLLPGFIVSNFLPEVSAQGLPMGFVIAEGSASPDGRYGVMVPTRDGVKESSAPKNSVVELRSGVVVAELDAEVMWDHSNHESILPTRWAEDGGWFLWEVDGKWFPHALTLVRLKEGKAAWQVNVLKEAQEAILSRTRVAAPERYAEARKANAGNGRAYPEGFSVDVAVREPLVWPMRFTVALTSNPKGMDGVPTLEARLEAEVDEKGSFRVTEFGLGRGESSHF